MGKDASPKGSSLTRTSRFLALVLRHKPSAAGIELDSHGWADVDALIAGVNATGRHKLNRATLEEIVRTDEKGRYAISDDGRRIRAVQGHSVHVDVELKRATPPETLYHGTAGRFLPSIRESGLMRGSRLYVHLSCDANTAAKVGGRHGTPVVLSVDAGQMDRDGFEFFLAENGVWLTSYVPREYLRFPEGE